MKRFMPILITVFLLALSVPAQAQQPIRDSSGTRIGAGLRLRLRPKQPRYKTGEQVSIIVTISNEGSGAIYVARDLGLCPTYWGGITLTVFDGQGREVPRTSCGDPYEIDPKSKDALRPLSEDLVLLFPRYSYSLTMVVEEVPSRPGRYNLAVTFIPSSLAEDKKKTIPSLPYPVFLGNLKAQTTIVRER